MLKCSNALLVLISHFSVEREGMGHQARPEIHHRQRSDEAKVEIQAQRSFSEKENLIRVHEERRDLR